MIKIGIDGNLLCGKKTGMGTVVYSVLQYWEADEEHSIILYLPEHIDADYENKLRSVGIQIKVLGIGNYFKWEQLILPRAIKQDELDVLWCPYNTAPIKTNCKTVVTINDVIYMSASFRSAPTLYKKMGILYRRTIVPIAARKASAIITISEYAKKEICYTIKNVKDKIEVIYLGTDLRAAKLSESDTTIFFKTNGIQDNFILGFGSLEMRKNSERLIKAYEMLSNEIRSRYQLVLFGFRGYEGSDQESYVNEHNLKNVVILGYVSDEEKNTLYSRCRLFVFPSLSEGFGIPVLEAFANHTPVVASNTTSIPEVAGNAALLISPTDLNAISGAITTMIEDAGFSSNLVEKGKKQLNQFDWSITAKRIYAKLCNTAEDCQ